MYCADFVEWSGLGTTGKRLRHHHPAVFARVLVASVVVVWSRGDTVAPAPSWEHVQGRCRTPGAQQVQQLAQRL